MSEYKTSSPPRRRKLGQYMEEMRNQNPNHLFYIEKSTNENVVVFDMKSGAAPTGSILKLYWLDLDPEYQAKKRRRGIDSDVVGLTLLEKKFAFAYRMIAPAGGWNRIVLKRCPDYPISVGRDAEGVARALMQVGGRIVMLWKIFLNMKSAIQVNNLVIHGTDVKTGQAFQYTVDNDKVDEIDFESIAAGGPEEEEEEEN